MAGDWAWARLGWTRRTSLTQTQSTAAQHTDTTLRRIRPMCLSKPKPGKSNCDNYSMMRLEPWSKLQPQVYILAWRCSWLSLPHASVSTLPAAATAAWWFTASNKETALTLTNNITLKLTGDKNSGTHCLVVQRGHFYNTTQNNLQ